MNTYALSIIIPTYNRSKLLEYSLDSLLDQTLPKSDFEVIVADDGSSDDTRLLVNKYQQQLNLTYVYQEDKGYRPASARNMGIKLAKGQICLFIDAGVILDIQCAEKHVAMHKSAGMSITALGYVYGFDQDGSCEEDIAAVIKADDPAGTIEKLTNACIGLDIREKYYKKYQDKIEDLPAPWALFWTCNLSARRSDLFDVGLFDENYDGRWGCEDNDLGFRIYQKGIPIMLCREAKSIHYPHGKDMSAKLSQGYNNCRYFHQKYSTTATRIFLEHYTQLVLNESVDINELIMQRSALPS